MYPPQEQMRIGMDRQMTFALRTTFEPLAQASAVRRIFRRLDSEVPVTRLRTMDEVVMRSLAVRRFTTLLVLVFAASALALTIVGLYGVVAYSVAQRRGEIGLRAALGARPATLRRHFLGQSMAVAGGGIVAGAAIMFVGGRLMSGLLFGVQHSDPRIYVGVGASLLLVSALAALEPAQRASRTDPARVLRAD